MSNWNTAQKMNFTIKDFISKYNQIRWKQETADLVTFTIEILNRKLHLFVQWKSPQEIENINGEHRDAPKGT